MTIPPYVISIIIQIATATILRILHANSLHVEPTKSPYGMTQWTGTPLSFRMHVQNHDRIVITIGYRTQNSNSEVVFEINLSDYQNDLKKLHKWMINTLRDMTAELHQTLTGDDINDPEPNDEIWDNAEARIDAYTAINNDGRLKMLANPYAPSILHPPTDEFRASSIASVIIVCRDLDRRVNELTTENTSLYMHIMQLHNRIDELENQTIYQP